jgi:hypothetical protein
VNAFPTFSPPHTLCYPIATILVCLDVSQMHNKLLTIPGPFPLRSAARSAMSIGAMSPICENAPIIHVEHHNERSEYSHISRTNTFRPILPRLQSTESIDRRKSSSIVLDACTKSHESLRQGRCDEGDEALETGLKALQTQLNEDSDYSRLGQAELKIAQGKKKEARDLLVSRDSQSEVRSAHSPPKRKKTDSPLDLDAGYEEMLRQSSIDLLELKDRLDALLRADAFDEAITVAHQLHRIDRSYFNIKTEMVSMSWFLLILSKPFF